MNHVNFGHIIENKNLLLTGSMYVIKIFDIRTGECIRNLQSSGLVSSSPNDFLEKKNNVPESESVRFYKIFF